METGMEQQVRTTTPAGFCPHPHGQISAFINYHYK
jgi:hypothetical protein